MQAFLENLGITILGHVLSWDSRIMVVYASTTLLIVFALWLYRGRPETFLSWVFPERIYRHRSNLVDIQIFLFNTVIGVLGLFAAIGFGRMMTASTMQALGNWFT